MVRRLFGPALDLRRAVGNANTQLQAMAVQLGILQYRLLHSQVDDVRLLWDAEYSVFSQWGEDGILDFLCLRLGISRPAIIDFGAGDISTANGRWILTHLGGSAVFVDARADLPETLRTSGLPFVSNTWALRRYITDEDASDTYDEGVGLLDGAVDIFMLDLDGQDYWILRSIKNLAAKVVVLEYMGLLGSQYCLTVPREPHFDRTQAHHSWLYYGASLPAYLDLMSRRGYQFVGTNSQRTNAFFVRSDLTGSLGEGFLSSMLTINNYVDSRINESRDLAGNLTFHQSDSRCLLIADQPFLNTVTGEVKALRDHLAIGD